MQGLSGKKVMITGATSGIGRATARRFFAEGAQLLLVDLQPDPELVQEFPHHMNFQQADVTDEHDQRLLSKLIAREGLDVLINNAGITRDATLLKMERSQWDQVMAVNLTAVFTMCQMAARHFQKQGSGVILNAASIVAHFGNYGQSNYAASKAGVVAMTQSMARELGRYGVRVNAVAPGFIQTPMVGTIPEKIVQLVREKTPLARLGCPQEIAAAYAFLASDEATFITGTCLNVDGGLVM